MAAEVITRSRQLLTARTAIALGVLAFTLDVTAIVVMAVTGQSAPQIVRICALLPTVAVGMLVAVRRPGNALGWLLLACGVAFPLQAAGVAYSALDYVHHHGRLPLGRLAIALQPGWAAGLVFVAGALWLFPDGRLPRGRWRLAGGALFAAGLLFGALMFVPWSIAAAAPVIRVDGSGTPLSIAHPTGPGLVWVVVENIGFFALLLSWLVWLVLQVPKYHRARGEYRQQLKWLYSGAVVFICCLGVSLFQATATGAAALLEAVQAAGVAALPVALGIAILRFRLYDIDRILSRTLAYAVLTGLLAGLYAGLVLLATEVLRLHSTVAVAAATLVAAALFNPLRRRVQRSVDRRFNRARYDAEATVAAFAGRLRGSVDIDSIRSELAATVDAAFEPGHVSVWLADRPR